MRFFNERQKTESRPETEREGGRPFCLAVLLLVCGLGLSGCGVTDYITASPAADAEGPAEEISPKEEEPKERTAAEDIPGKAEEVSSKSTENQEHLQVEENEVEEKESSISRDDLDRKREETGLTEADIAGLLELQAGNYYFAQLTDYEKRLYVEIYRILEVQAEEILLSTTDAEVLPKIYQAVINDHPEFFYLTGYTYTRFMRQDVAQYITFSGRYLYDAAEVARRQSMIDAAVDIKVNELIGKDDYETVKAVYEDLILSTDYSMDSPDNQNICSVFLDKKSVCNGYAKAAQYLLNYCGIPCIIVNGSASGGAHAWNIVEVDGAYYHMDATWGDPSYYSTDNEEKTGAPDIDYSYLCVTTAEITRNHTVDTMFEVPECSALQDNYFVREGLYLYGYDEGQIREIFDLAKTRGENAVCIKASDGQAYREIYDNLITEQKIFDYFGVFQNNGEYKIAYSGNEELCTINFWE